MKKILLYIILAICIVCVITVNFKFSTNNTQNTIPRNVDATEGGTINLYSSYPDTFNPVITEKQTNFQVLMNIYEGLFKVNPDKTVSSVLATGYEIEDSGKRYVINLKKDVVFHNGQSFGATDVIYTLDMMQENIEKYEELFKYIASYSALDDYKVSIELNEPIVDFVLYLDFPIVSSYFKDNEEFFNLSTDVLPCGTGPFMLKKDFTQTGMLLEKNPAWHQKQPYIDNLQITFMKDESTALYAFNSYQADIISSDIVKWGDFSFSNKMSIYEVTGNDYNYLAFNFENEALKNKEVRQAISLSIDKEKIVNDVMHSHAFGVNFPINPSAYYNPEEFKSEYDTEKAKNILVDNGWVDLNLDGVCEKTVYDSLVYLSFNLLVNESDKEAVSTADVIKENLKKINIQANVVLKSQEEFDNALKDKDFDLALVNCKLNKNGDLSNLIKSDGEENYYNYSNQKLDDALLNLHTATDKDAKKGAFLSFATVFKNDVVHLPLYFSSYAVYYQNYIKNFTYPSYNNIYNGIGDIYIKH